MEERKTDRHLAGPVRIKADTMARVEEIRQQTRLQKSEIASMLIDYALKHVRLVPAKCMDITFD